MPRTAFYGEWRSAYDFDGRSVLRGANRRTLGALPGKPGSGLLEQELGLARLTRGSSTISKEGIEQKDSDFFTPSRFRFAGQNQHARVSNEGQGLHSEW